MCIMDFNDKVIFITGASSGIGKVLTLELSKRNAYLIIAARNIEKLETVQQASANPERVKILPLDLNDYLNFDELKNRAIALYGRIDILINNGGVSQRSLAVETNITVDKKIFDVNYFGTIALTKALLPHFIERKSGHLVTVSSVVGKIGTPMRSSYSASKHALHGFFDSLRAEIYKHNIDVTLVCPGFVRTDVSINALTGDGTPQNIMDSATDKGLTPDHFAKKMIKAIAAKRQEVVISGFKEKLGVYVKRFFPKLFSNMVRKMAVT